jgi:diacylglycerol O-acyltransferase / wax synthase
MRSPARWHRRTCRPATFPSYSHETYVAGVRVQKRYPIGPLPGVVLMVMLVSRAGTCYVGARFDTDTLLLERCLQAGFDETLALSATDG